MNNIVQKIHPSDVCNLRVTQHLKKSSFPLKFRTLNLQFVDIIKKSIAASCLFIIVRAVKATLARLNHHHHPACDISICASEADR